MSDNPLDQLIPAQKTEMPRRVRWLEIKTIDDLLRDIELRRKALRIFGFGYDLERDHLFFKNLKFLFP